jgi:glycosyltransferase involved in cell wall biosynthesis
MALAMSGTRAVEAWRYLRRRGCPLVLYLWDLPPKDVGSGAADPVWYLGGRFFRWPRPVGGFRRRRGYYSRLRYIAARAQEVWVPSELSWSTVRRVFGIASRRVPYCYDSERFRPGRAIKDAPATLLTVSRLQPYKNQAATIRAAARLGREIQVRLIGYGPEQVTLERLAGSLGVRCRIDTEVDDTAVAEAYHRARVVICPSRFEGFGLTPLEAIGSGTPVVASDIPPHREFVGQTARLFPLDDDDALLTAAGTALDDGPPDSSQLRPFTIPATAERFRSLLAQLLS